MTNVDKSIDNPGACRPTSSVGSLASENIIIFDLAKSVLSLMDSFNLPALAQGQVRELQAFSTKQPRPEPMECPLTTFNLDR